MTIKEFRKKNIEEWDKMLNRLFNSHIPENHVWSNINEIIEKLNFISQDSNINHTYLPGRGGGLDLYGAGTSVEAGCIELHFCEERPAVHIIKPDCLIFQSFGKPFILAYFRWMRDALLKFSNLCFK